MYNNDFFIKGADTISLFCRLNLNTKKELPIRSSEMGLLIFIVKNEVATTPVMAAEFFKVKKPMITAMVNRLVSNGYLTKNPSLEDKRRYQLVPTQKAIALVEETYTEYSKIMDLLYNGLGNTNYELLISLLEKANTIILEERENE